MRGWSVVRGAVETGERFKEKAVRQISGTAELL
jgi:hypothetical protein